MAYLIESDYTIAISQDNLDEILTQAAFTSGLSNAQVLTNAQTWAIAKVTQYTAPKYQIAGEFSKSSPDTSRNPIVMDWVVTLAVWKLHMTVNPRDIPDVRQSAYEMSIDAMMKTLQGIEPLYGVPVVSTSVSAAFVSSGIKFVSEEFKDRGIYDPNSPNYIAPGSPGFYYP